jgi:paraquat-inducible protein A
MQSAVDAPCYFMCHVCSFPIPVDPRVNAPIICARCGEKNHRLRAKSSAATLSYSMTALILYFPANIYPFMTMELYGNRHTSTIWEGVLSLNESGSWMIAAVVFLASMLIPFLKLVILFYLSLVAKENKHPKFNTKLYHVIEAIGRWSMLDIFLLAVLVAIMKLGPWTTVRPELGSVLFVFVVIFTMLASSNFDPKLLWERENDKST